MYYKYHKENAIEVPHPFKRRITPLFMGDDDKIKDGNFSIHITEWEPGCAIDSHAHPNGMEAMYCMSGEGRVIVDHKEHSFQEGILIVAPKGIQHEIINTGDVMLRVLCVFSPPVTEKELRERAFAVI